MSGKKYAHAQYLITRMHSYGLHHPDTQQVQLVCGQAHFRCQAIILAAVSPLLKSYLASIAGDLSTSLIILPDLHPSHLELFIKYLHAGDVAQLYHPDHEAILQDVAHYLGITLQSSPSDEEAAFSDQLLSGQPQPPDHHLQPDEEQPEQEDGVTKKWSCRFCRKSYLHIKARNKHMLSEHFESCCNSGLVLTCDLCSANFVTQAGLDKHKSRQHLRPASGRKTATTTASSSPSSSSTLQPFVCPFEHEYGSVRPCFLTVKELKVHVKEQHPDKDKSCLGCGWECSSREQLDQHIQTHPTNSQEARVLFSCGTCERKFVTEYHLIYHKRNVHSAASTLLCKICGKDFKNRKFLRAHEVRHQTPDGIQHLPDGDDDDSGRRFRCTFTNAGGNEQCGKSFRLKSNLERHLRSHGRIKTHRCGECSKTFVDSTRLKEHRWIHSGHRPFKCRFCDKSYRHQNHVRNHEANVHGQDKKFCCQLCAKKFVYAYQLRTHLASHNAATNASSSRKRVATGGGGQHVSTVPPDQDLTDTAVAQTSTALPEPDEDDFVQTLYECSMCNQVMDSYAQLQAHCLEHHHSGAEQQPGDTVMMKPEEQQQQHIFLEITDPSGTATVMQGLDQASLLQDGHKYVVVCDVPAPLASSHPSS